MKKKAKRKISAPASRLLKKIWSECEAMARCEGARFKRNAAAAGGRIGSFDNQACLCLLAALEKAVATKLAGMEARCFSDIAASVLKNGMHHAER